MSKFSGRKRKVLFEIILFMMRLRRKVLAVLNMQTIRVRKADLQWNLTNLISHLRACHKAQFAEFEEKK